MEQGFGAFGKMPTIGDFFNVNPPAGFIPIWDNWLQNGILSTSQALADRWDENYMNAPIWRFALSSGLAGQQKVLGVLMPSVDRVGRRFPLTLMAPLETEGTAVLDHFMADSLFADLETLALDALSDTMTRDILVARLGNIHPPQFRSYAPVRSKNGSLAITQANADGILPELASGLLSTRYQQASIWSADVDGGPRLMTFEGLPDEHGIRALFDLNAPFWTEARPL